MSEELNHIRCLYNERGKNDFNSTTLANTLDKDIQTVFNSPEKFVMELLQNADDATDDHHHQSIDVTFQIAGQYLMFSHTGKHFDYQDVDAICDNAQQHIMGKKLNLNKTGYKGIGFKSVFVISECVYIISNQYCFRFDRQYSKWNHSSTNRERYPWQIVPIWTDHSELPPLLKFNNSHVNFIFQIKQDRIQTVPQAINQLLQNPYSILFLRNIRQITININNKIHSIKLSKSPVANSEYLLYINEEVNSKWFMISKQQKISNHIHDELQELKDHECPAKLKNATSVNIQFAIQLDSNHQVKLVSKNNLFCYLPTQVGCNLPFLVNADFLLSADRMQLLTNIWNEYLFQCIAKFHIESLQTISQIEQYRDDILTLFTAKLKSSLHESFINTYNQAIDAALDEIAFIPSHLSPSHLLKWRNAIADNLDFFICFPNTDPSYESKIASYTLRHREKLCNEFNRSVLTERIHEYATICLRQGCYEELLTFMISTYTKMDIELTLANIQSYERLGIPNKYCKSKSSSSLVNKAFLLTIKKELVSGRDTFLPIGSDSQLQQFLSSLNANFIHSKLLKIPGLKPWLIMMGVRNVTENALIDFIKEWISNQGIRLTNVKPIDSITIIRLLNDISTALIEREPLLKQLPLITKCGKLKPAKTCYLPSVLGPKFDLEKIAGNDADIVDNEIYSSVVSDVNKLKSILKSLKVQNNIQFFCDTFYSYNGHDSSKIDYFNEYSKPFKMAASHKQCNYHMAYLSYMRYLKVASYAKIFFKHLYQHNKELIAGMTNFRVTSQSNRNSYNYDVDHYLKFMLNREPCILAKDGQLYRMNDLYVISVIDRLDAKLKRHLPQMETKFDGETIELSDQLMKLLGARQELSCQDVVKLLNAITDEDANRYSEIFNTLYQLISTASWITSQNHNWCQLKLLATDGSRPPATSLYYFSCQHLRIQQNPNIFNSFANMTEKEELSLCRCFGVQILKDTDYIICHQQSFNHNQIDMIKHLLKMVVITAIKSNSIQDMNKLYHEWITKFEKLQIVPVQGLVLRINSDPNIVFKTDVIVSIHHRLYYEKELHLAEYIEVIAEYIKLSPEQINHLRTLALMNCNQMRERYLRQHRYDISAIAKLDETYSLLDDDDNSNSDLIQEATSGGYSSSDDNIKVNLTTNDATLPTDIHCSYGTDIASTCGSKDYKASESLGWEPPNIKLRLLTTDGLHQFDKDTDDLSNMNQYHKSLKQHFHDEMVPSCNDDEGMSSLEEQAIFKPCSPDEAVKVNVKFERFEGNCDPSSSSMDAIELGKILPNVGHFDSDNLLIPLHIDNTASAQVHRQESYQQDKTRNQWTGRWGEEFAYKCFIKYYQYKFKSIRKKTQSQGTTEIEGIDKKGNQLSISLTWFNGYQESNQPFDINVTKNGRQIYIEVKTTYKPKDMFVKVSHMEWKCMCQYRKDYRLCCVYNAGMQRNAAPIIKQIKDPASKFLNGTLIPREIHFKL